MRVLLLGLMLLVPGAAWADPFDADYTLLEWGYADYECRIGQTFIGTELNSDQSEYACGVRKRAQEALLSNGYCFDKSEQSWEACIGEKPIILPSWLIPVPEPKP